MSLFNELKRRRVFRVAVGYTVAAWVVAQVADLVADSFLAPPWFMQAVIAFLVVGLPVAVVLSWVFDVTRDGIVRAQEVDSDRPALTDMQAYGLLGGMFAAVAVTLYLIWPQTSPPATALSVDSIAVLPFANDSLAEENAEFFAAGMHDQLLNRLADISSLKVISRTSVMAYRDTTKNARQIGEELGVVYLLVGRVQRAGNRLRIVLQLIDSKTDDNVWNEDYEKELTAENIFALQAEMATSIATALHQTLSPEMTARLDQRPTENTRAYDFYLSGDQYLKRRQAELAIRQFGRAVEEDPAFAIAWAALSRAYSRAYWDGVSPLEVQLEKARDAAARALELVPDLPEAHFALGDFYMYVTREHGKALAELAIAVSGMPGSSDVQHTLAEVQRRSGDLEASIATTARAIDLDPRNTRLLEQQATSYAFVHDLEQFHRTLDRILEIEPDSVAVPGLRLRYGLRLGEDLARLRGIARKEDSTIAIEGTWIFDHWLLGIYERDFDGVLKFLEEVTPTGGGPVVSALLYGAFYTMTGQPELAHPHFENARKLLEPQVTDPNRPAARSRRLMLLAMATAGTGEFDDARRMAEESLEMRYPDEPMVMSTLLRQAALGVYIPAGDHDRAVALLDELFTAPSDSTFAGMARHPQIDPIRDHPGWLALIEKYQHESDRGQ